MQIYKVFIYILVWYSLLHISDGACRCKESSHVSSIPPPSNNTENKVQKSEYHYEDDGYYLKRKDCNYQTKTVAKVINPYKSAQSYVPSKPFGSVCLKCLACLAVTEQLKDLLQQLHEKYSTDYEMFAQGGGVEELRELCTKGFKNYDLRNFNGHSYIGAITSNSAHIQSGMDGLWTKKLRELCNSYLDQIDETALFSIYCEQKDVNINDFICKGKGIFRDCENVDYTTEEVPISVSGWKGYVTSCPKCVL